MKKVGLVLVMFLVFSMFFVFASSVNISSKIKLENSLSVSNNMGNYTRVLIKFNNSSNTNLGVQGAGQKALVNSIGAVTKGKAIDSMDGNMVAYLSKDEIDQLKNNSLVESVTPIRILHTSLQDSVPLINATSTWNLKVNNTNLTGLGQTICIIDTGVNYSHPDLGGCYGNNNASSSCKVIGGWDYCSDDTLCTTQDSNPMDVNGHGTHVSGIVAANGNIKGVAPDSKIFMVKAGNSTGDFSEDNLFNAIYLCINNALKFNISVISMSLGGGGYTSYCDNQSSASYNITAAINFAVQNNISVVVASGNDLYSNAVSFPGCIKSATAVGSTNKADSNVSYFSNTWNDSSLFMLVAPGENINSTSKDGGYITETGTSMATPHVAGVFAIMNQYLKLSNINQNVSQIKYVLNSTGKQIYDLPSNRSFSRIDVYSAIMALRNIVVGLNTPLDVAVANVTQQFNCSASSLNNLKNMTFYLWNSTGLVNTSSVNITGLSNGSVFNYNFSGKEDNYNWNCLVYNNNSESHFADANYSISYDLVAPNVSSIAPFPGDEQSSSTSKTFYYNISDNLRIKNCSLIVNGNISQTNTSITNQSINQSFTQTFTPGFYNWSVNCSDYGNNIANSLTQNFTITTPVTYSSGGGGGWGGGGGGGSSTQTFSLTVQQIETGASRLLGSKDRILFSNHSLTLNGISNGIAAITLRSDPINVSLYIGEEKKLNLTNALYYDVYIKLENISNNKANITLRQINESILVSNDGYNKIQLDQNNTDRNIGISDIRTNLFSMNKYTLIGVIICLITGILI
ncbi:MAG: S8 family serine peptidase [archaeon]